MRATRASSTYNVVYAPSGTPRRLASSPSAFSLSPPVEGADSFSRSTPYFSARCGYRIPTFFFFSSIRELDDFNIKVLQKPEAFCYHRIVHIIVFLTLDRISWEPRSNVCVDSKNILLIYRANRDTRKAILNHTRITLDLLYLLYITLHNLLVFHNLFYITV